MLNLIRMNLYRMAKTKSLWIVLLCMAAFCTFACSMVTIDLEEMQKIRKTIYREALRQFIKRKRRRRREDLGYRCRCRKRKMGRSLHF